MAEQILIIDDDPLLRASLGYSLTRAGFDVTSAANAEEGLALARRQRPDLVLLDIGLPGIDGLQAMDMFKAELRLPVILLTARRRGHDEAVGLNLGADDYVTKPYNLDVLLARMRVILRRYANRPVSPLTVGDLVINLRTHTATVAGHVLDLPPRVFDVLHLLASNAGTVVPLDTLLHDIWGTSYEGETQVVYVHIRWLRERLEAIPNSPVRIQTIHRVGYKLVARDA